MLIRLLPAPSRTLASAPRSKSFFIIRNAPWPAAMAKGVRPCLFFRFRSARDIRPNSRYMSTTSQLSTLHAECSGVLPAWSRISEMSSCRADIRIRTIRYCMFSAATCSTDSPRAFSTSTSAPPSRRSETTLAWPHCAARWKAVSPSRLRNRVLAPRWRRAWHVSACPYRAARCSGVVGQASESWPSTSRPSTSSRCSHSAVSPPSAARCSGSWGMSSNPGTRHSTNRRHRSTSRLKSRRERGAGLAPTCSSMSCRATLSGNTVSSALAGTLPCRCFTSSSPASPSRSTVYRSRGWRRSFGPVTWYSRQANSSSSGTVPRSIVEYPSQNSSNDTSPRSSTSKALKSCLRSSRLVHPSSDSTTS